MFSSLDRADFSWGRLRLALPLFLLMWLGIVLLLGLLLLLVQAALQKQDADGVSARLEVFIDQYRDGISLHGQGGGMDLAGLNFIRIVSSRQHLLLTTGGQIDFSHLTELDPLSHAVWIYLTENNQESWVISSMQTGGLIIQGGRLGHNLQPLFIRLRQICLWLVGTALIFLWIPALLMVRAALAPLIGLRENIDRSLAEGGLSIAGQKKYFIPETKGLYTSLNQLAEHNRKLMQEMQGSLDNVAHDLKTPLARLRSSAEYALQPGTDEQRLRNALSDCLEESEQVLAMLRVMMSVAEAESGTMRLALAETDLGSLIEDVKNLYEYIAEEQQIRLELVLQPDCRALVDPVRFRQVLANLVDNAVKYGRAGGYVRISLIKAEGRLIIKAADDGMGISAKEINRIWERLYRGDRSRSRPGLGLGLNYVKAVVEAHGGRIEADSKLKGGTTFTITLPLSKQQGAI
ncbi:MAG: hypothetical protein CSB24_01000 [Deltaproteobacteria bacterium]|nr:MAG: hypothetical protein CSB24_01000 [Deltaproteobacteria bacterium]